MRDGSLSGCQDIEWNWATGPGWLHLAVGLVLEGGDLLDGDLLLGGGVPGLHHGAVSALAQELGRLVAGSDLQPRCASGGGYQVEIPCLNVFSKY